MTYEIDDVEERALAGEQLLGVYHGRHGADRVRVTAVRDDARPDPYSWRCACGASQSFATAYHMERSAERHLRPHTLWDRLKQKVFGQYGTRGARSPSS